MPPGIEAAGRKGSGRNRLGELSDKALQRVLSFLPSVEAVQTLMLSRRWRDVWKDARFLRVTNAGDYVSANEVNFFVNMFLLLRNPQPLDVVEISAYPCAYSGKSKESLRYLELWVRKCLQREARVLRVHIVVSNWHRDHKFLFSKPANEHLRVLDLFRVKMKGILNNWEMYCLDFSCCPALEDVMMNECDIEAELIISPSLKRLTLKCCRFDADDRARISVPRLVFLILASCSGRTPILEKMPCLVAAFVRLQADMDWCPNKCETGDCTTCRQYSHCITERDTSVLLEALSCATHLELTSRRTEFIFRKDLTQCPLFSMLKTLLLNEWCVTESLDALRCFLQHCPSLEKLTIKFARAHVCSDKILENLVDSGDIYNMAKEPVPLKHLKVQVIRPKEVELDIWICKIQELLGSFSVPSEQIEIQQLPQQTESEGKYEDIDDYNESGVPWPSARFSFEEQAQLDNLSHRW